VGTIGAADTSMHPYFGWLATRQMAGYLAVPYSVSMIYCGILAVAS